MMVMGGPHSTNTVDCVAMQCRAVVGTTSKWPTGEQEKNQPEMMGMVQLLMTQQKTFNLQKMYISVLSFTHCGFCSFVVCLIPSILSFFVHAQPVLMHFLVNGMSCFVKMKIEIGHWDLRSKLQIFGTCFKFFEEVHSF